MRKLALLLAVVASCKGPSQEARKEPPQPAPSSGAVVAPPVVGEEVAVDYRPQSAGQAMIEVASPAGARVDIREGQALIGRDTAPMAITAQADHWYVVAARLPSGANREAKVQARASQIASLRFIDAPRCYRVPIIVEVVSGGMKQTEHATLVMHKRGLERIERDKDSNPALTEIGLEPT